MQLHPHIHCVIPACGITPEGEVKIFDERFLLSDKALSAVFRGKFIALLKQSHQDGKLLLPDTVPSNDSLESLLTESCKAAWVVYSNAPFAGPDVVVKYLARYTHLVPRGFVRIRHCGFLCHSKKRKALLLIRKELQCGTRVSDPVLNPHSYPKCPCCGGTSWI